MHQCHKMGRNKCHGSGPLFRDVEHRMTHLQPTSNQQRWAGQRYVLTRALPTFAPQKRHHVIRGLELQLVVILLMCSASSLAVLAKHPDWLQAVFCNSMTATLALYSNKIVGCTAHLWAFWRL